MENLFMTTLRIFLWKHWKCFHYSWIKNILMIVVPIAIVWFQIHVSSGHTNGVQRIFDPIKAVNYYYVTHNIISTLFHIANSQPIDTRIPVSQLHSNFRLFGNSCESFGNNELH